MRGIDGWVDVWNGCLDQLDGWEMSVMNRWMDREMSGRSRWMMGR